MLSFFQHHMIRATSLLIFHLKKSLATSSLVAFSPSKTHLQMAGLRGCLLHVCFQTDLLVKQLMPVTTSRLAGSLNFEFFALAENCALQRKISLFHAKLLEPKPFRFFSLALMNIHVHESVKGLFCEQVATTLRTLLQSIVSSSNLVIIVVGSSWKETFMTSGSRTTPLECTLPMDKIPHQLISYLSYHSQCFCLKWCMMSSVFFPNCTYICMNT